MITFQVDGFDCHIDEQDADLLQTNWRLWKNKKGNTFYLRGRPVKRGDKGRPMVDYIEQTIHRVILSRKLGRPLDRNEQTDHKDLNGLNNTRENIRLATPLQNIANRPVQSVSATGVKGVRQTPKGRFVARIKINGIRKHIGTFDTAEEAHAAYMAEANRIHGEFARG